MNSNIGNLRALVFSQAQESSIDLLIIAHAVDCYHYVFRLSNNLSSIRIRMVRVPTIEVDGRIQSLVYIFTVNVKILRVV